MEVLYKVIELFKVLAESIEEYIKNYLEIEYIIFFTTITIILIIIKVKKNNN
ncbi:MAG: hypothetical protein PHD20_06610 [Clostridia bacterium]|nr:hypothetical protein [Clostridia bacterium]